MTGTSTFLICYHPYRHTYTVEEATCQVCPTCLAVRSTADGRWPTERRLLHKAGHMTDPDTGRHVHHDWRAVLRRLDV